MPCNHRLAPALALITLVGACRPAPSSGIYVGPLPCPPPRAGPGQVRFSTTPDSTLPPSHGALVVQLIDVPTKSVLGVGGATRVRTLADTLPLRRDSTAGAWILDSAAAGSYLLDPRHIGWATDTVSVHVRAAYRDTVVVPLDRAVACLWARLVPAAERGVAADGPSGIMVMRLAGSALAGGFPPHGAGGARS